MKGLVLFASYPKSGNTWFRAMLASVLANGKEIDINNIGFMNSADRFFFDRTLGINSADLTRPEVARLRPRIYEFALRRTSHDLPLKVHDAWLPTFPDTPIPFPEAFVKRAIYIVRDPRDVAVSLADHMGRPVDHIVSKMNKVDYFFGSNMSNLRMQVTQRLSTWSAHVRSWMDAQSLDVHVMKYEQMLAEPLKEFRFAFDYLGLGLEDRVISDAVEATRFDKLKSQEEKSGFSERSARSTRFFRRGVANGWRDTLTEDQTDRIVSDHREVMERLGYVI